MCTFEKRDPAIDTFILISYEMLRNDDLTGQPYDRLHTVYSHFNATFRKLFVGIDPVKYCQARAEEGLLQVSIARGGALLKPCLTLLVEPTTEQAALAKRYRELLLDVVAKRKEQRLSRREAKNTPPTGSRKEKRAQELWHEGGVAAALKKLGY